MKIDWDRVMSTAFGVILGVATLVAALIALMLWIGTP